MNQQPDLFGGGRRPQQRWIDAQARRDAARAKFDALPQTERDAIWTRIDRLLFVEATWRVARTMPDNPHAYTRRRDWQDDADWKWLITMIREGGIADREKHDGRWYDVLNYRGAKFWPMGWPIDWPNGKPCTVILNKKPVWDTDQ